MICPFLADACDFRINPLDPFQRLDRDGAVVADTVFWRDGGLLSLETDRGALGEGCLVIVREDAYGAVEFAP